MKLIFCAVVCLSLLSCASNSDHQTKGYNHKHLSKHKKHHRHHDFSDAEKWAKRFNDPKRDEWQKPIEVVKLMNLKPGQKVADIGAGTGYMISYLSRAVGDAGRVYALDVEVSLVEYMNAQFQKQKLANAEARYIAKDDPAIGPLELDKVLLVNTWHHVSDREAYAKKLYSQLKPDSEIYLVEFNYEKSDFGPSLEMRLKPEQLQSELSQVGFDCSELSESLPRQYLVRCRR